MGCGDNWPLCNGRLIPPLSDPATFIEWSHRLVALVVSLLVVGVAALAYARRNDAGVSGRGGALRPAVVAAVLLVIQVLLGAVTVWLELPPSTVILHLGTTMAMVAVLMVVGFRAGTYVPDPGPAARRMRIAALVALGLGGLAVLMGGLTANIGASAACLGFPLCSGELFPSQANGGLSHIHWFHRLVAYALTLHLTGIVVAVVRQKACVPSPIRKAAIVALGATLLQIVVAAGMMFSILQPHWRATHVAAGTGVWMALVAFAWFTSERRPRPASHD